MEQTGIAENRDRRKFLEAASLFCGGFALSSLGNPNTAIAKAATAPGEAPPVRIPQASIRMRCPDSLLMGISLSEIIEISLAEVIKFHGFCAGGGTFAFRAAKEAFAALYGDRLAQRHAIKVHTSHHCCQAGALAYITGARTNFGAYGDQGDLTLIPEEDKKFVFIDKISGKSVTLKPLFNPHQTFAPLFQKVRKDAAFAPEVRKVLNEKIEEYLKAPAEKLFAIE